jgi:molybdenum cofactor guanylyltransferase
MTSATQRPAGLIIAGGRSTRFGSEKALAPFAGMSLLEHAIQRLQRDADPLAINARRESATARWAEEQGFNLICDLPGMPDGPLTGVLEGLKWAKKMGARQLLTRPCDTPLLPADLAPRLLATQAEVAIAVTPRGREPLCALWPVSAIARLQAALQDGRHPPTWQMLESLGAVPVTFEDADAFANANTPDELQRLEQRASAHQE